MVFGQILVRHGRWSALRWIWETSYVRMVLGVRSGLVRREGVSRRRTLLLRSWVRGLGSIQWMGLNGCLLTSFEGFILRGLHVVRGRYLVTVLFGKCNWGPDRCHPREWNRVTRWRNVRPLFLIWFLTIIIDLQFFGILPGKMSFGCKLRRIVREERMAVRLRCFCG